jgi:hypothetical protein
LCDVVGYVGGAVSYAKGRSGRLLPLGTLDANRAWQTAGVIAHNLVALLSAVVADVNHRRLQEQLEQSPEPPPRPAAARVANHNTKLVRR